MTKEKMDVKRMEYDLLFSNIPVKNCGQRKSLKIHVEF